MEDKTSVSLCNKPDRISKLIVSTAILNNFRVNHGLSIEYDNSDQEMPVELAKTDSNDNGVLLRQEIIGLFTNLKCYFCTCHCIYV